MCQTLLWICLTYLDRDRYRFDICIHIHTYLLRQRVIYPYYLAPLGSPKANISYYQPRKQQRVGTSRDQPHKTSDRSGLYSLESCPSAKF